MSKTPVIIKEQIISKIEVDGENKTVSIRKDEIIKENDIELARNHHRRAFVPGELEEVKEYMGVEEGPEIAYLESLWTEEVIQAYQDILGQ